MVRPLSSSFLKSTLDIANLGENDYKTQLGATLGKQESIQRMIHGLEPESEKVIPYGHSKKGDRVPPQLDE